MKFDFSQIPATLDVLHAGLLAIIFALLILFVILLTTVVIGLLRKPRAEQRTTVVEKAVEAPKAIEQKSAPDPIILKEATPDSALQMLGLLQQEARFIDFIKEDVSAYSDSDIGAAARVVHDGCRKVLNSHFDFEPIRSEQEDARVTIPKGFDSSAIRLTGNIVGKAPFKGTLLHRGWRATRVKLPKISDGHDVHIIASAEVEL